MISRDCLLRKETLRTFHFVTHALYNKAGCIYGKLLKHRSYMYIKIKIIFVNQNILECTSSFNYGVKAPSTNRTNRII